MWWLSEYGLLLLAILLTTAGFLYLLRNWRLTTSNAGPHWKPVWCGAAAIAFLWHGISVLAALDASDHDSFYTLSLSQRLGLLTCSGLLIGLFAYLSQLKTRWIVKVWITRAAITQGSDHSWLRLFLVCIGDALATILFFTLVYGSAPQLYYLYYQQIIPGLPSQWVIRALFDLGAIFDLFVIRPTFNHAEMLAGLTLWTSLLAVVLHHWIRVTYCYPFSRLLLFGFVVVIGCGMWLEKM